MALPTTENFNGTTNDQLTTYSANWTLRDGDFDIQTNQVAPDDPAADECCAYWNADAFDPNHYSKITPNGYANGLIGVATRIQPGANSYYGVYSGAAASYSFDVDAGAWTQQFTDASIATGTVLELRSNGSSHDVYEDDVINSTLSFTDAGLSGGAAGICGYNDDAGCLADSWEGGDIAAGASITSVPATVARGETGVIIGISGASAAQGAATVTLGGESCTITTYPGASGNLLVTIPDTIDLLYATATHTFVYTDDDTTSDTSAAVPFTPASGRSYIALVSPVYSGDEYLAYGYEGTPAPVSTDQLEYPDVTTPDSITFTVNADSEWILDSMPTSTQTVTCQIIRAATSVRSASWTVTYLVSGGKISTDSLNLGLRLGL